MYNFEQIKKIAAQNGWMLLTEQPLSSMISFTKHRVRINVYDGRRGITVASCLDHPRRGKTQLFRKNVSLDLLDKIFKNPRLHTSAGYYVDSPDQKPKPVQNKIEFGGKASWTKRLARKLITFLQKYA